MESDFYKNKHTVDKYIRMAKDHDGTEIIQILKPYLKPKATVLEIGSGPGSDFEILRKDHSVVGSDYSQEFVTRLKMLFPEDTFLELDAITLKTNMVFDVIYSNKVLHHLTDEELKHSIVSQSEILNGHGIICHSFWKGNGTENFNGMFVNNHTEDRLRHFFEPYFKILLLKRYKEFEEGDSLLLIAQKK
ncbi:MULTISPECIES: class I SAM-dependent methyltransferase [unclassified Saccharicrinis]|uniref:class I SAM-dependent methyltransferase n=1 Tax=unclassified Saccharicrinis TaxID=2646859 RepID=UPI003D32BDA9